MEEKSPNNDNNNNNNNNNNDNTNNNNIYIIDFDNLDNSLYKLSDKKKMILVTHIIGQHTVKYSRKRISQLKGNKCNKLQSAMHYLIKQFGCLNKNQLAMDAFFLDGIRSLINYYSDIFFNAIIHDKEHYFLDLIKQYIFSNKQELFAELWTTTILYTGIGINKYRSFIIPYWKQLQKEFGIDITVNYSYIKKNQLLDIYNINKSVQSITTGNNDGIQLYNIKQLLNKYIKLIINYIDNGIHLHILGDARNTTKNLTMCLLGMKLLPFNMKDKLKYLSNNRQYFLPTNLFYGKDSLKDIQFHCSNILMQLHQLNNDKITVIINKEVIKEIKFNISYGGDHMFRHNLTGNSGPREEYPDIYGIIRQDQLSNFDIYCPISKSIEFINQANTYRNKILLEEPNIIESKLNDIMKNKYYGYNGNSLVYVGMEMVIPGVLHLVIRLITTVFQWTYLITTHLNINDIFFNKCKEYNIFIKVKIQEDYITSNISGKDIDKIIKNIHSILTVFINDQYHSILTMIWNETINCYNLLMYYPREEEINNKIKKEKLAAMWNQQSLLLCKILVNCFGPKSITITLRTLSDHIGYWISIYGSLIYFLEECIESQHEFENTLYFQSTMRGGGWKDNKKGKYATIERIFHLNYYFKWLTEKYSTINMESKIKKSIKHWNNNINLSQHFLSDYKKCIYFNEDNISILSDNNIIPLSEADEEEEIENSLSYSQISTIDTIDINEMINNEEDEEVEDENENLFIASNKLSVSTLYLKQFNVLNNIYLNEIERKLSLKIYYKKKKRFELLISINQNSYSIKFFFALLAGINIINNDTLYATIIIQMLRLPEYYKGIKNNKTNRLCWEKTNESIISTVNESNIYKFIVFKREAEIIKQKLISTDIGFQQLLSTIIDENNNTNYISNNILFQPLLPSCMRNISMEIPLLVQTDKILVTTIELIKNRNIIESRFCISCEKQINDINKHYICLPKRIKQEIEQNVNNNNNNNNNEINNDWNNLEVISIYTNTTEQNSTPEDLIIQIEVNSNNNKKKGKKKKKNRKNISQWQKDRLRYFFKRNKYPKLNERIQIANEIGLKELNINHWFKNKRKSKTIWAIIRNNLHNDLEPNVDFLSKKYKINNKKIIKYIKLYKNSIIDILN